jgi:antitoxin MazE
MRALARRKRRDYDVITSFPQASRMRAKLVRIGNSRGIRIPKAMIDELALGDEVELTVKKGEIVVSRVRKVREGWAEDAKRMVERGEDGIVWPEMDLYQTDFVKNEWYWDLT